MHSDLGPLGPHFRDKLLKPLRADGHLPTSLGLGRSGFRDVQGGGGFKVEGSWRTSRDPLRNWGNVNNQEVPPLKLSIPDNPMHRIKLHEVEVAVLPEGFVLAVLESLSLSLGGGGEGGSGSENPLF